MSRWKCICSYDGTDFNGWQSQRCGNTIQDFIENRLKVVFKKDIRIHGSGRTDSGVHAKGQVFHFDAPWDNTLANLFRALQTGLPSSILITQIAPVPKDFHARFGAIGKHYSYHLYLGQVCPLKTRYTWSLGGRWTLDIDAMQKAAHFALGTHDFRAFGVQCSDKESTVKTLYKLSVNKHGRHLSIQTKGSGYLYKMVRTLVGTLVEVGRGKLSPADFRRLLKGKERTHEIVTAPAKGLCLDKVFYH